MTAAAAGGGPLHGVRILDLTRLLPGAYCTLVLADLGADVVKVEEPSRGDPIREWPPIVDGVSAAHSALDRGKRSIALDLRSPEGVSALRRLTRSADALVESFRPGVLERLGAGAAALAEENPRLVHASITGYGQEGPDRDVAGHDIDFIARSGILGLNAPAEGPPILPPVQVADLGAAMAAAVGVVSCLDEARRTGRGRRVDVAMLEVAFSWLASAGASLAATAETQAERGAGMLTGGLACYRVYATADGRHLAVGALEPKFWSALCEAVGVPELIGDHLAPGPRQAEMAARLEAIFGSATLAEWMRRLEGVDACVAPVNDVAGALADRQLLHRGATGPPGVRSPLRVEGAAASARPAPELGEHTSEVLEEAGFGPEEIALHRRAGTP